jgi:hypothetical protein
VPESLLKHEIPLAKAYALKLRQTGLTHAQIADRLGRGVTWCMVRGWLRRPRYIKWQNKTPVVLSGAPRTLKAGAGALGWAAGFFDGEGTVAFRKGKPQYIGVINTHYPALERFKECVGGLGRIAPQKTPEGHLPAWTWRLGGADSRAIIARLRPYLLVKFDAATKYLNEAQSLRPYLSGSKRGRKKS